MFRTTCVALALVACGACGKKSTDHTKDDAAAGPAVAPLSTPTIGIESPKRFNFTWEAGASAYAAAVTAYKTKQWAAVRADCEAALAKDPNHLDAHRLLATALAQLGEHAAAVDHLVTALAADYWKYAPSIATDDDLKEFLGTQHGQALTALSAKLRADYEKRSASALILVGRRSTYKWPREAGVQSSASRGELYAYDRETRRYLRLTHTDHKVVGFVRAAAGNEVTVLGFDKVDHPKVETEASLFAAPWLQVYDATEWKEVGTKIALSSAREIAVGYGAGDQLLVSLDGTVSSIDRTTGKLTKVTTALPAPRISATLDEGRLVRLPDGIEAVWSGDPPTTPNFKTAAGATVRIPESGAAGQASIAVAPGGARVAFATAVDPCAKDTAPSLYVADAKTAALKHLLTAKSRFATRWLDANLLAYEDGEGAIRMWDATIGREVARVDNKSGIALDVLSLAPAPVCKQAPPTVEPAGAGSGDELPPEEGSGPITAPQ